MKNRIYQIDLLKIIGLFFVVMVHHLVFIVDTSTKYPFLYILKSCVPIFMICTGFFLFKKEKNIKDMWKQNILRFIVPYLLICLLGLVITVVSTPSRLNTLPSFLLEFASKWQLHDMTGYSFHLWYILALLGIYISYPVLNLLCKEDEEISKIRRYVMLITLITGFISPTIEITFGINIFPRYGLAIFDMYYVLYVLLGYEFYLLYKKDLIEQFSKKYYLWILIFGTVLCTLFTKGSYILLEYNIKGMALTPYGLYNTVPILIFSIGFILFIWRIKIKNVKLQNFICHLGRNSFVYYLIHSFIVTPINTKTNLGSNLNNYISPLLTLILISLFSFIITVILGEVIVWLINGVKRSLNENKRPAIN